MDSPNRWDVDSAAMRVSAREPRPSTRSASTAPASTEVSWSGSPTRISRLSGRTASSSRAIIVSETIEVSSTTTTSCGSRLSRWWRKRVDESGREPSSRCSVTACSPVSRSWSTTSSRLDLLAHRLLRAGRGLAGRRGQGDAQRRLAGRRRLLGEQGQQRRDRRGLAGAGAAGQHGGALGEGDRRGGPLLVVALRREDPRQARGRGWPAPRRRAAAARVGRAGRRRPAPPRASSGRGRAAPRARAGATGGDPASGLARDRAQPTPRRRARAGRRRRCRPRRCAGRRRPTRRAPRARRPPPPGPPDSSDSPASAVSRRATCTSTASITPADVELAEQPGGAEGEPGVVGVLGLQDRHATPSTRASSRSDRASTSGAGGRQLKTPAGWPSVSGVSGPHIPRR